jgi:hypothetical protein
MIFFRLLERLNKHLEKNASEIVALQELKLDRKICYSVHLN